MAIAAADFNLIRNLVYEQSAIVLEPGKEYLVEARLQPLAQKEGLDSLEALIGKLRSNHNSGLGKKVIEAMTTNETSFFRDLHPFETLKKEILPDLIKKRSAEKTLNIWCGASSSGQEPYSLAMLLRENFPQLMSWKINFTASDISREMLERCREGYYSQLEVNRGLPAMLMVKYFERKGMQWQIKPELRNMIDFKEINLCSPWPLYSKMDLIFMRNVLIYFDVETKRKIFNKLYKQINPDGFLFLGAAETTVNLTNNFVRAQFKQSGCYRIESQ